MGDRNIGKGDPWTFSSRFLGFHSFGSIFLSLIFLFMHSGPIHMPIHLLLNCWAIYIFGRDVEQALGRRSFLTLYFSSGIMGGLLQVAFDKVLAQILQQPGFLQMHVVGASAGAF